MGDQANQELVLWIDGKSTGKHAVFLPWNLAVHIWNEWILVHCHASLLQGMLWPRQSNQLEKFKQRFSWRFGAPIMGWGANGVSFASTIMCNIWGFPWMGVPQARRMLYQGKSQSKMDDWGYPILGDPHILERHGIKSARQVSPSVSCNQVTIINCGTIGPKFIHRKHRATRNIAVCANDNKQ